MQTTQSGQPDNSGVLKFLRGAHGPTPGKSQTYSLTLVPFTFIQCTWRLNTNLQVFHLIFFRGLQREQGPLNTPLPSSYDHCHNQYGSSHLRVCRSSYCSVAIHTAAESRQKWSPISSLPAQTIIIHLGPVCFKNNLKHTYTAKQ